MRNKRRIIVVAVVIAFLGGLAWLVVPGSSSSNDPIYKGKPFGIWARNLAEEHRDITADEVAQAIDELGTNAVPALLQMLRAYDYPLKTGLLNIARSQSLIRIRHADAFLLNGVGLLGFIALGPRAAPAVPELVRIYDQRISPSSQKTIALILGNIGDKAKAAVPSLLRETGNANNEVRESAFGALAGIHEDPQALVPHFIKGLQDASEVVRYDSARGLGNFFADARPAVPALVNFIKKGDAGNPRPTFRVLVSAVDVREAAINSLKEIEPETAKKLAAELHETW